MTFRDAGARRAMRRMRVREFALSRNLFLLVILILAVLMPGVSYWANSISPSGVKVLDTGIYGESSTDFDTESIAVYVQMLEFAPETRRAQMAFYPWPTDDIAKQLSSSVITTRGIKFLVDSQNSSIVEFEPGDQVGAVYATVDVLSSDYQEMASDSLYPFDQYVMDSFAQVQIAQAENQFVPVQTFDYFYSSPVPGFDITYQRLGAFDSGYAGDPSSATLEQIDFERFMGKISFYAFIERSFAVKAIALFIYGFILISSLALVWVASRMVLGKRPPSMESLIWAAASMLGILELRALAPGEPRIGVYADLIFFFPSLMMSLVSVATITYLWSSSRFTD